MILILFQKGPFRFWSLYYELCIYAAVKRSIVMLCQQMNILFSSTPKEDMSLCSRNFQNVKLRLDLVEIWSFYRISDFTWNQLLVNSNGPKMLILAILEVLNFDFSKFEQLSSTKFTKIQSLEALNLPKMTFLDRLKSPKCDIT